jgi:hypothetical protein
LTVQDLQAAVIGPVICALDDDGESLAIRPQAAILFLEDHGAIVRRRPRHEPGLIRIQQPRAHKRVFRLALSGEPARAAKKPVVATALLLADIFIP